MRADEYTERRQRAADEAWESLSRAINGPVGYGEVANAILHEHPTLTGQIAKAVGVGLMRHATREPEWKPFEGYGDSLMCQSHPEVVLGSGARWRLPDHPIHDGRFDCQTVVAAELMARQSFI